MWKKFFKKKKKERKKRKKKKEKKEKKEKKMMRYWHLHSLSICSGLMPLKFTFLPVFYSLQGRVPLPQPWHICFKWIFNQTLLFHMADLPQLTTWKSLCDESVRTLSAPVDTSLGTPSPEVSFCFQISSTVNPLAWFTHFKPTNTHLTLKNSVTLP